MITGLAAKYKDPQTGLPYANLDAYRELRKQYPAPAKETSATGGEAPADADAGDDAAATDPSQPPPGVPQRPIILSTGPCGRRINKVA